MAYVSQSVPFWHIGKAVLVFGVIYSHHRMQNKLERHAGNAPALYSDWKSDASLLGQCRMERIVGIEPTYEAWKASVLPLNYIRKLKEQIRWIDSEPLIQSEDLPEWLLWPTHLSLKWSG